MRVFWAGLLLAAAVGAEDLRSCAACDEEKLERTENNAEPVGPCATCRATRVGLTLSQARGAEHVRSAGSGGCTRPLDLLHPDPTWRRARAKPPVPRSNQAPAAAAVAER